MSYIFFTYEKLLQIIDNDSKKSINWARQNGLLAKKCICCEIEMKEKTTNDNIEKLRWKCSKCKKTKTIKFNSIFEKSKLSINLLIKLIYWWSKGLNAENTAKQLAIKSDNTIVNWFEVLRDFVSFYLSSNQTKLGGRNKIVEIDEMKLGKRKYHRGRRIEGQWIFGMIERDSDPLKICFFPVNDRTMSTLKEIIINYVEPESIIISDCWKAYNFLENYNYIHLKVNHSHEFLDPITGAHTNNIEGSWNLLRKSMPRFGTTKRMYYGYLQEHIWRRINKNKDLFFEIIKIISEIYFFE